MTWLNQLTDESALLERTQYVVWLRNLLRSHKVAN